MAKRNGGIIGPANTPTASVAAGVWRLRDAFNSIKNGTWPLTKSVATNSLRFNSGSSDYLNRTPASASNRKTWTYSSWFKRSNLGNGSNYMCLFSAGTTVNDSDFFRLLLTDQDQIYAQDRRSASFVTLLRTEAVYRDISAWYHIVLAYDTTQSTDSNRVKLYINGTQITVFGAATYPTQNYDGDVNNNILHRIGQQANNASGYYFDGYMSEVHLIDGQALTPSSFGASNSSGVWYPIAYQGTWGTNGFYLKFANSASLGTDSSGNGNNWTVNNLTSVDQSTDTELNNFCTSNPLDKDSSLTLTEGNLKCASPNDSTFRGGRSTFGITTGKWYWEVKASTVVSGDARAYVGISTQQYTNFTTYLGANAYGWGYYSNDGNKSNSGTQSAYGASWSSNDIIGVAFDATNGTLIFYKNGTSQGTAFTGITGDTYFPTVTNYCQGGSEASVLYNFGSPPYSANGYTDAAGYGNFSYAVPSGYYALCTANLNTYG